jgi:peptide/nickel transport system ATP-binding protein
VCEQLCVLQHGQVREQGARDRLLTQPQHDYTRRLIAAQRPLQRVSGRALRSGSSARADAEPLLDVAALSVRYVGARSDAVTAAGFVLERGQTLALVGESGSGKSTLGRALLRLQPASPDASIRFDGQELTALSARTLKPLRRRLQIVFQDPYASLDPRQRVARILAEPLRIHGLPCDRDRLGALLQAVELDPAQLDRYPDEFSGGQRQRIAIARALATDPDLLVCDEAVSALDALVRGQILALLERLRRERGLALLFITHDLEVAAALADRIAVMQGGQIVEQGEARARLQAPQHPYTRALLAARIAPLESRR